jgi:hypothetical protein
MMSTQPPEPREVLRPRLETTPPPGGQSSDAVDTTYSCDHEREDRDWDEALTVVSSPDRGFTGPISWEMRAEVAASITGRRSTVPPVADRVR